MSYQVVKIPVLFVGVFVVTSSQVELQPTLQSLFDMIHRVSRNLITVIQAVPRVALQLTDKQVGPQFNMHGVPGVV